MVAAGGIVVVAYVLMILGNTQRFPSDLTPLLLCILALGAVTHLANRVFVPDSNAVVMPIVFLLNGLGYVMIARIDEALCHRSTCVPDYPHYAPLQAAWTAGGVAAYIITLAVVRRSRDLDRYRYLLLAGGVILLLLPLVPGLGLNIQGARLWIRIGSFEFQPVEIGKIVLCIFFASYFADKRELLTIPTARLGNRLVLDPRPMVPIVLAWGFAILVMSAEHDIGFSALLFTLFIGLLWVTTGRTGYLVIGLILFGFGAYITGKYFSQTHVRVEDWLNPWALADGSGRQLVQSWYALGNGGIGGTGLGLGQAAVLRHQLQHRLHLRGHRRGDGPAGVDHGHRGLPAPGGRRTPHRPDGPVGVRQAGGHRSHHHHRLPGLLHHRWDRAALPADRHHPPLHLLRGLGPDRQLRAGGPAHAHLRRGDGGR